MRFPKIIITWTVVSLLSASLFGMAPTDAAVIEHPTPHENHISHDCAEVCAVSNNSANLPSATLNHPAEDQKNKSDPTQKPNPHFYINFIRHANSQKTSTPNLYRVSQFRPPDLYKLDTSYLN